MVLSKKKRINWRLRLTQLIALLLVLYALTDITVLQAYCGNEAVGIPPAHHLVKNNQDSTEKEFQFQENQNTLSKSHNQEESPEDCSDECCFCCSSHSILNYFRFESKMFEVKLAQTNSLSYENNHSNTELHYLFRPPRIT